MARDGTPLLCSSVAWWLEESTTFKLTAESIRVYGKGSLLRTLSYYGHLVHLSSCNTLFRISIRVLQAERIHAFA